MIGRLQGVVIDRGLDGCCVLDVGGVGYELFVPARTLSLLPEAPATATLHVHTHVREDALLLYGFASLEDRRVFRAMLGIKNVGTKLALSILGELASGELAAVVAREDKVRLSKVSGVGRKTAERLVLELKDKLPSLVSSPGTFSAPAAAAAAGGTGLPPAASGPAGEVVAALTSLGFNRGEAERAAAQVVAADETRPVEVLLRQALASLA
ncbi:MAG: Holliday junction branch migration protein RuvA [Myxococcales bacterium]|nr:Holliday junction branch migration protein RuvA [Myxococcales bacterium]